VVGAKLQQITVKEWLPLLGINEEELRANANAKKTPGVSVEFATGA
jgi:hypothetical protein